MRARLLTGDCLKRMPELATASVDAIVTDPPYGLEFMGRDWDRGVPGPAYWTEALRVAKPGAMLLAFGGTRTSHRLVAAIEDAGWEIRDSIIWLYGTGFPKSRRHLKPAHEPIAVARKRGKGGMNVKACMVPGQPWTPKYCTGLARGKYFSNGETPRIHKQPHAAGRWPANVIHDGSPDVLAVFPDVHGAGFAQGPQGKWKDGTNQVYGKGVGAGPSGARFGDSGSAARFFYCAKASRRDRGEGNTHPTVKPTTLMRYLCRLVTPAGGTILDPFMGSGTTGKAAKQEGFHFIGFDLDAGYVATARRRIKTA